MAKKIHVEYDADTAIPLGEGQFEIVCVICGEPQIMQVGDKGHVLVRYCRGFQEVAPVHTPCADSPAAKAWLKCTTVKQQRKDRKRRLP